ncbi:MAG: InlB B-repeat-containing protein [Clostridia bacterium]|nr:InlB B-repeat-containing protein [Clostridia bacterium]
MKKLISLILAAVLLCPALAFWVEAAGNDILSATPMAVDKEYSGSISKANPADYYKFSLSASGRIRVKVSAQMKQARLFIYDEERKEVFRDYRIADKLTNMILIDDVLDLVCGTYFFRFSEWEGYAGTYSFSIPFESADESFKETQATTDNLITTANEIQTGKSYRGQIAKNDSVDYYRFSVPCEQKLPILVTAYFDCASFHIYASDHKEVFCSYQCKPDALTGSVELISSKTLPEGTYYFCVRFYHQEGQAKQETGSYTFTLGEAAPTTCVVTFDGNGGTPSESRIGPVPEGTSITWPAASRSGYMFLGWSTSSAAVSPSYYAGNSYTVNSDMTLYAVWKIIPPALLFTVSYVGNGGTVSGSGESVRNGAVITLPSASRSGYTFLGWSEDSHASSPSCKAGDRYTVTKDVTLYAVWGQKPNALQKLRQKLTDSFERIMNLIRKLFGQC